MKNVLIADDFKILRKGLAYTINNTNKFHVAAEANDGNEAYSIIDNQDIDIVIIDISMPPGESGLVTIKRIHDYHPEVKQIVLSMHEEPEYINTAIANGALSYILKSSDEQELLHALDHADVDESYIDKNIVMTQNDYKSIKEQHEVEEKKLDKLSFINLSRREREVLPLICLGFSNQEIAEKLFVTRKTIEAHKTNIMKKLGFSTRRELLHFAMQHHLIDF
ncbi:response regulator [Companilactobacillus mishanensis]|uniref:Response regulator transcription factor n=1 Tax=Companilactobacillus mishanensis TaxID=2486008 RepID=A0A5P0ZKJ7_9LACO|nr:response regulator transcription factor [Companilactobacillus mishanensis]MQS45903.1 response regulator transcription factor [Companilactobacillus mishanensis]MQS53603.1 response regulator transcription factor [Companilactobacillus mishanensis]MQS89969.1 response regulator transcription factor [Companilactobacillus mishanensis]